ncbi:MAG: DUF87 domain-containing protein [Candidatus Nitrosotenuis sp.]
MINNVQITQLIEVFKLGTDIIIDPRVMKFGCVVDSVQENVIGIGPDDFSRHVYILGSTGSGKSTLIRNLYKHLELANNIGTLKNSLIYIDVKGEDSTLFLRQCEKLSFDNDLITYLDINKTNFGINLLELPKYEEKDRDITISRTVGHIMEMFKEFYSQQQTFVQLERILRLLLHYLYSNTDTPTLLDLYEIIVRLQRGGRNELREIFRYYKNTANSEMNLALDSISSLAKDSWISLFNRIEPFATDNYLKKKFSVKHTTIDFEKMLMPGNITIFRISDTDTPKHVHGMAIMAIVIKIWFAIQNRSSKIEQEKRKLVILSLDEFQRIKDLSILATILSQARAYNLGLILSHQNLAQISVDLLETIVGNTATQIYGRVSGIDAGKIARIIDPYFGDNLTNQITTQPDFVFTAKTRPMQGQEQNPPIQFLAMMPPPLVVDKREMEVFLEKMRDRYVVTETIQSDLRLEENKKTAWKKQLCAELRPKDEWLIILFLYQNIANIKETVEATNSTDRYVTGKLIRKLIADNVVRIDETIQHGCITEHRYALTPEALDLYFPSIFQSIGTAKDIDEVATKAFQYYISKQMFVSLARQDRRSDGTMCDMVVYDYEHDAAISVEIESISQVKSHPEQVRYNMIKWKHLGFSECHVWSKSSKVQEIRDKLGKESEKTRIFRV